MRPLFCSLLLSSLHMGIFQSVKIIYTMWYYGANIPLLGIGVGNVLKISGLCRWHNSEH